MMNLNDVTEILLNTGLISFIDNCDKDLSQFKWHVAKTHNPLYAMRTLHFWVNDKRRTKKLIMHRLIMSRVLNRDLDRCEIVDHINGNTMDNRRSNLRLTTYFGNTTNSKRRKDNTSGYKGVIWSKQRNKWQARIKSKGHVYHIGYFNDPRSAHEAYKIKATELFGEFARFE